MIQEMCIKSQNNMTEQHQELNDKISFLTYIKLVYDTQHHSKSEHMYQILNSQIKEPINGEKVFLVLLYMVSKHYKLA